tara:strand:- start:182337 stop:182582 length:246 start_codon:yes stop_codon:yes gene_type:complete
MKTLITIMVIFASTEVMAEKKVVYKYKEYEKFDLGDMEIKGNIIAPGDLSVKERRRRVFERDLLKRKDFDQKIVNDIKFIR